MNILRAALIAHNQSLDIVMALVTGYNSIFLNSLAVILSMTKAAGYLLILNQLLKQPIV